MELKIDELVGKTLVTVTGCEKGSDEIYFTTECGRLYKMYHEQDCCEEVRIEDVNGCVEDITNTPILSAYETIKEDSEGWESQTCTFYNIQTIKGFVNLRWLGESNGYYSESVDFTEIKPKNVS